MPFVGLVALVLATWTTNVTNAYSGGLALSNLLGFDESKFKVTTGVAGAIGTLLAAFGLLNAFQSFLSLMSALIPPLAGVLIASYWIVGKGKRENFSPRPGFSAVGVGQRNCGFSGPLCGSREADVRKADARKADCVISVAGGAGICPLLLCTAIITKEGKGHAKNRNP